MARQAAASSALRSLLLMGESACVCSCRDLVTGSARGAALQQTLEAAACSGRWRSFAAVPDGFASQQRDRSFKANADRRADLGKDKSRKRSEVFPPVKAGEDSTPVQDTFTPNSKCFGCGPANLDGLKLKSRRVQGGLEADIIIPQKYCAFPGIVNGGIISTVMDCHGNWTAAIALMDSSGLPMPPLTLTASVFISFKDPTPPDTPLIMRSKVISISESLTGVNKATVEVDVSVYERQTYGPEKLLVQGTVMCKKLGALRAL